MGQGSGPLAARAAHLARRLAGRFALGEALIEVFPKATLLSRGLNLPYKKHLRARETRAEILEGLRSELTFGPGIWRERAVQSDHVFEAILCAFSGFLAVWEGGAFRLRRVQPSATKNGFFVRLNRLGNLALIPPELHPG